MNLWTLFLVAVGLSLDAFAVSICKGLSAGERLRPAHCLLCGVWFGGFQALMPLLGWLLGARFRDMIATVDHWIAFGLLGAIGLNMLWGAREEAECLDPSLSPRAMLPLAVATSIDALAAGGTFAFLQVGILPAVALIGLTTLVLSSIGAWCGSGFGARFRARAERAGGVILILMGFSILLDHLGPL